MFQDFTRTYRWCAPSQVRYQIRHWGTDLAEGDVLVSNHPQLAGGSHLPDITVITPGAFTITFIT